MSTAARHLQAVPPSPSAEAPRPLGDTVTIDMERYCELLTIEILAAEAVARTWQHRRRGWLRVALGITRAMGNVVRPEFVAAHLRDDEREAYLAEQES